MSATERIAPLVGLVGALVLTATSLVTAVAYRGTQGEAFSPLNHWVSELGELGVSSLANIFNLGLIVAGACFAIFMAMLALTLGGRLAWLYGLIGVIAGIAGGLVGVFPMNEIGVHRLVALAFFNLGWIAVGLASIDIWRRNEPRFARWLPYLGALTVALFICFLAVYLPLLSYTGVGDNRPALSLATTLEWLVLAGIIGWTFAASLTWWRHAHASHD